MEKADGEVSKVRVEAMSQLRKAKDSAGKEIPLTPAEAHRALIRLAKSWACHNDCHDEL
jgi:hypothetical protein